MNRIEEMEAKAAWDKKFAQVCRLRELGWIEKDGFWSNPKYTQRRLYEEVEFEDVFLFTFEQVIKKEGLE